MGGSSAEAPTTPDGIRASDEERDEAVSELREQFAEGRLSQETFMHRMDEALGARSRRQLDGLFTDLPRRRPGAGALAALRASVSGAARRWRAALAEEKAALAASVRDSFRPPLPGVPPPAVPPPVVLAGPPADLFFPSAVGGTGIRYTIGRDSRCDLLIEHTSVSRWHARLERAAGRWVLTDLGSTNGTRLNGWRVHHPVPVQPGDQVSFGSARFVVRTDRQGGASPIPPGQARPGQPGPGSG
jgi:FHA domain/Domain of unknown function (DUF1707)